MENIHTSNPFYIYKAKVTDVYDGDTITVDIELGFYTKLQDQKIRLYGINTPEMKGSDKIKGNYSLDKCNTNSDCLTGLTCNNNKCYDPVT
jgi:endonuclease YncB( thermonuclease family)